MREFKDRVQDTTQTTGTGPFTLDSGAIPGFRTFGAAHTTGSTFDYFVGMGGEWEVGTGTLTDSTHVARSPSASSNGGALVSFSAGSKTIFETIGAAFLSGLPQASDIGFTTTVPLTNTAGAYMPNQAVSGPMAFSPAAGPVRGAYTIVGLIADGVNVPTFPGFTEHGSSTGYDNRAQYLNVIQFFFVAGTNWWANSQAATPVPVPSPATGVSLAGPTSGVVNIASSNFTVAFMPVGGTNSGSVTVTPTPVTGVTFSPTSVTISTGSSATFTATSATTGAKAIVVTNNGGLTNPTAITWTVAAAATAPAQMAAPTAAGGDATASVVMTAPPDGGSSITGYTVTSSPAGMIDSNAGATNLTHAMTGGTNGTSYTFTARATNAVGTSVASPASNSVTLAAAPAAFPRMALLSNVIESGTGPYVYTSNGTSNYGGAPGPGGVLTMTFKSGVDGSIACTISGFTAHGEPILGLSTASTLQAFSSLSYGLYGVQSASYKVITSGTIGNATTTLATAAGDILRLRRVGSTLYAEVARAASPTSFTIVHTWAGVSTGVLYVNGMIAGGTGEPAQNLSGFTSFGLS